MATVYEVYHLVFAALSVVIILLCAHQLFVTYESASELQTVFHRCFTAISLLAIVYHVVCYVESTSGRTMTLRIVEMLSIYFFSLVGLYVLAELVRLTVRNTQRTAEMNDEHFDSSISFSVFPIIVGVAVLAVCVNALLNSLYDSIVFNAISYFFFGVILCVLLLVLWRFAYILQQHLADLRARIGNQNALSIDGFLYFLGFISAFCLAILAFVLISLVGYLRRPCLACWPFSRADFSLEYFSPLITVCLFIGLAQTWTWGTSSGRGGTGTGGASRGANHHSGSGGSGGGRQARESRVGVELSVNVNASASSTYATVTSPTSHHTRALPSL